MTVQLLPGTLANEPHPSITGKLDVPRAGQLPAQVAVQRSSAPRASASYPSALAGSAPPSCMAAPLLTAALLLLAAVPVSGCYEARVRRRKSASAYTIRFAALPHCCARDGVEDPNPNTAESSCDAGGGVPRVRGRISGRSDCPVYLTRQTSCGWEWRDSRCGNCSA